MQRRHARVFKSVRSNTICGLQLHYTLSRLPLPAKRGEGRGEGSNTFWKSAVSNWIWYNLPAQSLPIWSVLRSLVCFGVFYCLWVFIHRASDFFRSSHPKPTVLGLIW